MLSIISLRAMRYAQRSDWINKLSILRHTGYDMKSGVYSTWTESIWQTLSVRMFLKPSAAAERFSIILGSLVAGVSFILVYLINARADVLFNSRFVYIYRGFI